MGILGWIGIAAIFYAAAEYEHMPPWPWAIASVSISGIVDGLLPFSFIFILPAQFVLFLAFWWAHARHKAQSEVERAGFFLEATGGGGKTEAEGKKRRRDSFRRGRNLRSLRSE